MKKVEESSIIVMADVAKKINEARKLDKQKKEIEKQIKEIRESLNLTEKGTYTDKEGTVLLVIAHQDRKTDPNPKEIWDFLKSKKLGKFFWSCVKVQLTEVKKYISDIELSKFQTKLDPTVKWTFK
jgi:hypothetical protein